MNAPQELPAVLSADPLGLGIGAVEDLEQAEFEVMHPVTDEPTGLFITLAGPEHPKRKEISMNLTRAVRASVEKRMAGRGRGGAAMTDPKDDAEEQLKRLAECTLGWRRNDDKPFVPWSHKAAEELYRNPKSQWIVRQVLARFNDLELFIKA